LSESTIRLPDRPLRVHPPGAGHRAQLTVLLWAVFAVAAMVFGVIRPIGDLLVDRELVGKVAPVPDAKVSGRCSTGLVLTSCDATLSVARPGRPEITREVHYFFLDEHTGDYEIEVVADPARPELLSTDMAMEKLTNRLVTLVVFGPLFLGCALVVAARARRKIQRQRAALRALSGQVLRAVVLRMERYELGRWAVSGFPPDASGPAVWQVPDRARPIVMDPARKAVLGITASDGRIAMPLDTGLTWLELRDAERDGILEQLRPEQLAGGFAALDTDQARAMRSRLRRSAKVAAIAGLCAAALAGGGAWMTFHPRDTGTGALVELHRGDEAPASAQVRLRGVWQTAHMARITRSDAHAARLETWIAVTAPGWTQPQLATWVVRDASQGMVTSGLATRSGTVLGDGPPPEARAELARQGIGLAPTVHVLDVPIPPQDPLQIPALAAMVLGLALAIGLLLGAAVIAAKARRHASILRS